MVKQDVDKQNAHRRWAITIIAAIVSAIVTGISFVLFLLRVPNMHIASFLVLGCSVLLVTYLIIRALSISKKHAKLARLLKRCYLICLAIGLACFLTLQGLIISGARSDDEQADCIIILGAGLRNGVPSRILRYRLDAAINYLSEYGDMPVIVAGGYGSGQTISEAEAMYRYLSARGVDENLIWKEDASTNTRENIAFAMVIMEDIGLDVENIKVAVVSNEFHLFRAKLIANRAGLDAVGVAAQTPGIHLIILYFFREAFSLAVEFVR